MLLTGTFLAIWLASLYLMGRPQTGGVNELFTLGLFLFLPPFTIGFVIRGFIVGLSMGLAVLGVALLSWYLFLMPWAAA
jgi:hypothetical protein